MSWMMPSYMTLRMLFGNVSGTQASNKWSVYTMINATELPVFLFLQNWLNYVRSSCS